MNRHIHAALILVGLLVVATPALLLQASGITNASLISGFMLPIEHLLHAPLLLIIGCIAAWLGREMLVLLPLCCLIMLALGAILHVENTMFPAVQAYSAGAILLFAFITSMMQHKASMFSVVPVGLWAYFSGGNYFTHLPEGIQPVFYLLGMIMSAGLLMAIGVALAITVAEAFNLFFKKLSKFAAFASFLSLF